MIQRSTDIIDTLIARTGPVAITLTHHLAPVAGEAIKPPTFAAGDGNHFPGGYCLDRGHDGRSRVLVDSPAAQARRISQALKEDETLASLIPHTIITAGSRQVDAVDAGHRAADAVLRCCDGLRDEIDAAFRAVLVGDHVPLARLHPLSMLFGCWDSRATMAKVPRILESVIEAHDVLALTACAQYVPPLEYRAEGLLDGIEASDDDLASRGYSHRPATGRPIGGVIARGGIVRSGALHLGGIRRYRSPDPEATRLMRRYLTALGMVAITLPQDLFLRSGCNLVTEPGKPLTIDTVNGNGERSALGVSFEEAVALASDAAKSFGIDPTPRHFEFSRVAAAADLGAGERRAAKAKANGKKVGK